MPLYLSVLSSVRALDNGEILSKFYVCFEVVMAMRAFEVQAYSYYHNNYYLLLLGAGDRCPITSPIDINKLIIELHLGWNRTTYFRIRIERSRSGHTIVAHMMVSGVRIIFGDSGNMPHVCDDDTSIRNCIMMNPHKCDPPLKITSSIFLHFPFANAG